MGSYNLDDWDPKMMAPGKGCLDIVRTYPGSRTGDTIYVTEDGRHWVSEPYRVSTSATTGEERARLRNGRVCPHE